MRLDKSLEPFRATIESINRLLQNYDFRGVIIGGIAVGLLGKPRYTADVDAVFLLSTQDIPRFLEIARLENIIPRIQNAEEFARKNRILLPETCVNEYGGRHFPRYFAFRGRNG